MIMNHQGADYKEPPVLSLLPENHIQKNWQRNCYILVNMNTDFQRMNKQMLKNICSISWTLNRTCGTCLNPST